jgi:predicted porin
MNKKLIAVALAALPVAAMADVTLYGTLKAGIENDSITNQASQNKVQDQTSIIGFKGTEDLGNGLKTVWQVENRVHADGTGSDSFGSRQTFVGLDAGNYGTVRLGYINNTLNDNYAIDQWQYSSTTSISTTNGVASLSGANGLGIFTNSGDRLKNAIRYDSATFYGLSGSLVYGMGENKSQTGYGTDGSTKASNILGIGLNYTYGDVSAHYAFNRENNPNQAGADTTLGNNNNNSATKHLLEVDYSANNLFVSGAYQMSTGYDWADDFAGDAGTSYTVNGTTYNPINGKLKARQAAFSVAYTIGAFTPKFSYAKGWNMKQDSTTIANSGYSQYVLGVDYALSKRTVAGLSYGRVNYEKGTSVATALDSGNDVALKTFGLTMAHSF